MLSKTTTDVARVQDRERLTSVSDACADYLHHRQELLNFVNCGFFDPRGDDEDIEYFDEYGAPVAATHARFAEHRRAVLSQKLRELAQRFPDAEAERVRWLEVANDVRPDDEPDDREPIRITNRRVGAAISRLIAAHDREWAKSGERGFIERIRSGAPLMAPRAPKAVEDAEADDAVYKDPAIAAAMAEMNATYAVVLIGSKVRILRIGSDGVPVFLGIDDFRNLDNRKLLVPAGNCDFKAIKRTKLWLDWHQRREYINGVVFAPGVPQTELPHEFNLWRGWPVAPDPKASCDLFLAHIRDNICQGDRGQYEFVLDWCADIIQNPMDKPGSSLVIRSPIGGTGKSTFAYYLRKAFGRYAVTLTAKNQLVGNFNAIQEGRILVVAEEAFFSGDHEANNALKNMISDSTIVIERKGIDAFETTNHARYILISNDDAVVQATLGNSRRYMVLTCGDAQRDNADYFEALRAQMDKRGGLAAFVHLLQTRKLRDPTRAWLRRPPITEGLRDQIDLGLTREDEFFIEAIARGQIGDAASTLPPIIFSEDTETEVFTDDLVAAYIESVRPSGFDLRRATAKNIRNKAERYWAIAGGDDNRRVDTTGRRRRVIVVAALPRCREKLAAMGVTGF